MNPALLSIAIKFEHDIVSARQRVRQVAELLGFDTQDQTRLATAVSEISRNAFNYAKGGKIDFFIEGRTPPQLLMVRIADRGPGIDDLPKILEGRYRSNTGMGLGIIGARRLMDQFQIESKPGEGTTVWLKKILPRTAPLIGPERLSQIVNELSVQHPQTPLDEVKLQNQELLRTLDELRRRQEELARLNRELEDTNRGVVALYAELDEKADRLRLADVMKSKFLSNMSHEFRTPLNSILALSRILLENTSGNLNQEQSKQVNFIRKAAQDLSELVNDLLDLAKVESGKVVVRPAEFAISSLFGALRGMLRPILINDALNLIFEASDDLPNIFTDEGKVSQILRNFISNAIKFTERGEVRVSATLAPSGDAIIFSVADTGIGISPEHLELIFLEFTQIDSSIQRQVKGTGLGLPLTRRLAELLGGSVSVTSTPGIGSTFSAIIPCRYSIDGSSVAKSPILDDKALVLASEPDPNRIPVLVVEDESESIYIYDQILKDTPFQLFVARSVWEARQSIEQVNPQAIILDIRLGSEDSWSLLAELKAQRPNHSLPVLVVTLVDDRQKALALGADDYATKPIEPDWLKERLSSLTRKSQPNLALLIDDNESARYILKELLTTWSFEVMESSGGCEGLKLAKAERPGIIFLDLVMPDLSGFEVAHRLKEDPVTNQIPLVMTSSLKLSDEQVAVLAPITQAFIPKEALASNTGSDKLGEVLAQIGLRRIL